ncbi:hypothetical protein QYE76_033511 [Lolium multiflorum]|uniref:Gag-pol polyprotein n=1 Tax=Lolium multiflorum TaxID=4521 RepID=A0AAD8QZ85_LOLMU|nr:hypothetical protein QYE76_033511 [Lolium multiflorum]
MRHFCANFYRACKSKELSDLLQDCCLAYSERRFANLYNGLLKHKDLNAGGQEFLHRHLIFNSKWARAYDEDGRRYGQMTSNMAECFNNVLKGVRALPVTAIIQYTFEKLNVYFQNYTDETEKEIANNCEFPTKVQEFMDFQARKADSQTATCYDNVDWVYQVNEPGGTTQGMATQPTKGKGAWEGNDKEESVWEEAVRTVRKREKEALERKRREEIAKKKEEDDRMQRGYEEYLLRNKRRNDKLKAERDREARAKFLRSCQLEQIARERANRMHLEEVAREAERIKEERAQMEDAKTEERHHFFDSVVQLARDIREKEELAEESKKKKARGREPLPRSDVPLAMYQEETSIARGEEQLDMKTDVKMAVKLDMELDMKISHGRAREEGGMRERRRRRPADIITWREYEALRNEMRREFRIKDDELKSTVDEIKQTLDATNVTVTGLSDQMTDIQRNIADMRLAIENLTAQQQQDDDEDPELADDAHNARGGVDVEEYLTWELKIEKLWSLHPHYSEDRKIKLASSEFDGYALRWWDSLVRNLDEDGAQPIRTWRAMKEAMTSRFVPTNYMRNIFDKLTLLRQGVKTVDEYYMEMEMLMQRGRVRESLEMTMQRFLNGLKYDVKGIVRHYTYTNMNQLLHHAREVESQLAEEVKVKGRATGAGCFTPRAPSTAPAPSTRSAPYSTPPSKPVSNVSNAKKSESAASMSGSSMSTTRNRDMLCHTCGGKGHFKRDCPNRKVMFVNEDNEYETGDDVDPNAPDDDDYDTDGEDAYPSDARTIVVSQRALNVLPSASTQRCNLFQTKALVGPDKACKVIIDGGSCRNLASKELCTKLKLKYLPHPHPYYIQWLSDNGEMKEFGDVFPEEVPAGLPPLRGIEHQIDLIPGASLPNRAPYRTNPEETKEIQKQVQALLDKGYIRISLSPCAVPVILVPKKDEDMLDELSGAAVFSKIDLHSGYHQIRMKEGDEWKTAFKTKFGLYEWLVMPFGLTNAPSTFMRLMNHVLREFIGKFVVVYFDDILIYSRNESDHTIHIRHVLQVLRDNQLYGNLEKCTFCKDKVIFLGYVVSKHGVEVDVSKIEAIQNWPTPMNVSQESHAGGLMGHFGREKTLLMLADHFYWPKMRRDVDRYVRRCITCNKFKSKLKPHAAGGTFMSITLGAATKLLDDMMMNGTRKELHKVRRSNVDPNNVPLASLVAQEENVDVNFIKNNNFNNNAYRNNSGNNYRPYPSANGNGYGNSYGNSYNNNRSVPSGLEAMLKEFISTQTAFNKSVEEKLDKIDTIASRVDRLASDVNLLKLKVMPNNDIDNKITTTANAIQVRINENIRLMAELRARWDREENEKLAKENNVAKVWTITTTSNANSSHVAAPPTINGKIIGVGNVSTPSAKRTKCLKLLLKLLVIKLLNFFQPWEQ